MPLGVGSIPEMGPTKPVFRETPDGPIFRAQMPSGAFLDSNPGERRQSRIANNEAAAEAFRKNSMATFKAMSPKYGEMAVNAAADRGRSEEYDPGKDDHYKEAREIVRQKESMDASAQNARTHVTISPGQAADNRRLDDRLFNDEMKEWEKTEGLPQEGVDHRAFDKQRSAINAMQKGGKNAVLQKGVMYPIARYITGPGVLTDAEFNTTMGNLSGLWGQLKTKLEQKAFGTIEDQEWAVVRQAADEYRRISIERATRALENFPGRFQFPGNKWVGLGLGPEVEARRKSLYHRFGIPVPKDSKASADRAEAIRRELKGKAR